MNGWVKLHRSFMDWEWHGDLPVAWLFLHLIIMASIEDKRWQGHEIRRGSLATSYPSLATVTGLSVQQVRTALGKLKSTGEITVERQPNFSVITIKNYAKYQDINSLDNGQTTVNQQSNNSRATVEQQSSNSQSTPSKEIKNDKELKETKEPKKERIYYPLDDALDAAFRDYVAMRKKLRSPMTDRAIELNMKRLQELSSDLYGVMDNDKAIKILEQSIANSWKGLFPLDDEKKGRNNRDGEIDLVQAWRDVL
jgi:hypothetical protein